MVELEDMSVEGAKVDEIAVAVSIIGERVDWALP